MGDIFSNPENNPIMQRVFQPPPGLLQNTLGGIAVAIEQEYHTIRNIQPLADVPDKAISFLRRLDAALTTIKSNRPDVLTCIDPSVDAAVVYQRLRFRRHAMMRYTLRILLAQIRQFGRGTEVFLFSFVEEYNCLVSRTKRCAMDGELIHDIASLLRRADAYTASSPDQNEALMLLCRLLRHLRDDPDTYRGRIRNANDASVSSPSAAAPPSTPSAPAPAPEPRPVVVVVPSPSDGTHRFRTPIVVRLCPTAALPSPDGCVICMDAACRPRLPCGHKTMCTQCAASVDRCPLCRDAFDPSEVAWEDSCNESFVGASLP